MPPCSFLLCGISVGEKLSLDVTVFFLIYMDKIVCSNSDSNKKVIREQYILGSDGGETMEST